MRGTALLIALAIAPLCLSAQQVTVEQLVDTIAGRQAANASDTDLARRVAALELKELLTATRLGELTSQFKPGPETSQALVLLADSSAFLSPPESELPSQAAPTVQAQQAMMTRP